MKLIRKIGTRVDKKGYLRSYGEFLCPFCLQLVERLLSCGKIQKSCGCNKNKLISEAHKGKILFEEHKQKISKTRIEKSLAKGKNNPFYNKKHTNITKYKMKENHADFKGNNNPNWKNGISFEEYGIGFNKDLKQLILERDNYTCQNPNCKVKKPKRLDCHHIDYDKQNNIAENLITLCISCHMKTNYNRIFWQEVYKNL